MPPPNANHWITDPEYIDLINYLIDRVESVKSAMNISSLARGFKEKSGAAQTEKALNDRIFNFRTKIHTFDHIDTNTKVKLVFALSAPVNANFLKKLKEDAFVEIDEKQRIIHYKSNDGSLELSGDHSSSAKSRTVQLESKQSIRSTIINYLENKNDADAVPKNKKEKEMWNLIEFITQKCGTVDSPLSIQQLATDFINHSGKSRSEETIRTRIKVYCNEIQGIESLDTSSKVKQLFVLSATLNSEFLKKLREDALVDVDEKNRITMYTANDNSLTLRGSHWGSGKTNPTRIRKKTVEGVLKMFGYGGLDDGRDGYSSEELGSEFDTDDEAGKKEMSIEDDFEFTPKSSKRKTDPTGSSSSKRARPSSNDSMRPNELDDYDMNYSMDHQFKSEPFFGSIQEDLNEIEEDGDIQRIPKSLQVHVKHNQIEEVPIKIEVEEPVEVKPETSHNSKIKFFEAMQSLILCLDTPSLSWIQTKIHQKIQKLGGLDEVIQNNEIVLIVDLLIARMTNHSVVNLSQNVESVNLSSLFCYLKAAIQISKLSGIEDLVKNINKLIGQTQNKNVPTEKVADALCTTLYIDGY